MKYLKLSLLFVILLTFSTTYADMHSCQRMNPGDEPPATFSQENFPCSLPGGTGILDWWGYTYFSHDRPKVSLSVTNNRSASIKVDIQYHDHCVPNPNNVPIAKAEPINHDLQNVIAANSTYHVDITSDCSPALFQSSGWQEFIKQYGLQSWVNVWESIHVAVVSTSPGAFNSVLVTATESP